MNSDRTFCVVNFTAILHPDNPKFGQINSKVNGQAGILGSAEEDVRLKLEHLLEKNLLILESENSGAFYELPTAPIGDEKEDALFDKIQLFGYYLLLSASSLSSGKN